MALKPFDGEFEPISDSTPEAPARRLKPFSGQYDPLPEKSGILRRTLGDGAVTAAKSVIGVGEAAVGLADLASAAPRAAMRAASGREFGVGKALEQLGYDPKRTKDALDELYSPEQQAANARVAESDGFVDTAKAMIQNPSTIVHTAGESVGPMLAGGAIARGAGAVSRLPAWVRGAMGEGAVGGGMSAESIRQQTEGGVNTLEQDAIAALSGVGTGLIGAGGARLANRLGIGEVDTLLAGGPDAAQSAGKGVLRRAAEGAVVEGVIQEAPQSAQEAALENLALDRPVSEGVGSAVAGGMLAGGLIGGAAGPLGGRSRSEQVPADAAPGAEAGVPPASPEATRESIDQITGVTREPSRTADQARKDMEAALGEQVEPQVIIDESGRAKTTTSKYEIDLYHAREARSQVQPMPTPENPSPAPVARPDPNNGPLSSAASLLPEPVTVSPAIEPVQLPPQDMAATAWDSMNAFERGAAARDVLGGAPDVASRQWADLTPDQQQALTNTVNQQQGQRWTDPNRRATDQQGPVLQNRDRSSPASIRQMTEIANRPDYDKVSYSRTFMDGAPVVLDEIQLSTAQLGKQEQVTTAGARRIPIQYAAVEAGQLLPSNRMDGTSVAEYAEGAPGMARAIAGNGRVAGLTEAWNRGAAQDYKQRMIKDEAAHGIPGSVIESMRQPVLVRLMPQDEATDNIGDVSNTPGQLGLDSLEQAKTDMNRVSLQDLQFGDDGQITTDTVMGFVRSLPSTENLVSDGTISREARDRLEAAIFHKAYGNDELTRMQAERDDDSRSIINALVRAAPQMIQLEGAGPYDIRPMVTEAATAAINARRRGMRLSSYIQQQEMGVAPGIYPILEMMLNERGSIRSADYIGQQLSQMAQMAYNEASASSIDLFGERPRRSTDQVIQDSATGVQGHGQLVTGGPEGVGEQGRAEPAAQMDAGQENDGSGSPDAEPAATTASEGIDTPELILETQTEESLAELAAQRQAAERTEQEAQARAEADEQAGAFTLTGSDRSADEAAARGQEDLLGAKPRQERTAAPGIEGRDIDGDWAEFSADSGTLSIPRSDMPQIRAEHRGAMVQFLAARDIGRQEETVPASSLKPTQAEYSRKKVEKAKAFTGGNRSILVSADGHVLDGHHQWMAARDAGEDVKIIRLDAPISELLPLAHEFPSSSTDGGAVESTAAPGRQEEAGQVSAPEGVSLNQLQQRDVAEGRPGLAGELTPSTMASLAAMRNNPNVPAQQVGRNGAYTDTIPFIDVGDGFEVRGYSINGEVRQEIRLPNGMIATRGLLPDGSIYGSAEGNFEQIVEGQGFPEIEQYFTEFAQARKRRAVTPAIEQAAPTPIEDAGEKLGGARKDELRTVRERLDDMGDEAIASSKLSELWPKGEVDRITDPFHAAAYHAARGYIPTKPRATYRVKRWVEQVKAARGLLADLAELGADASVARMREHSPSLNVLADQVELYMGIDRAHWGRVSDAKMRRGRYNQDGEMVPGSWVELKVDKRGKSFYGHESIASALPAINASLNSKPAAEKKQKFNIYTRTANGEVFISADADKERRALKSFESTGEARKYLADQHDDLVAAWEAVKNRDNVTKADMRRKANEARVGQDYRNGKDVTPEQFLEQFGFRGVEFGNWVKQGKGGQERQGVLNDAYDAFMDLASAIGVPPRALSLEGRLGIGFGSRGAGWASAHFESDTVVINLTKTRGAGALAHEWFHAMDNYFAHKRGVPQFTGDNAAYRKEAFVTYRPEPMMVRKDTLGTRYRLALTRADLAQRRERNPNDPQLAADAWVTDPEHKQGVRPVVEKSFAELVHTLNSSPMAKRARVIDKGKADGYWSQIIERGARAFETYVIARLADQGARNDYLANVQTLEEFSRNPDRYPYLTPDEQGPVNEAFDKLFSTIETQETDSGGVAMFRRSGGATSATLSRGDVEQVAARLVTEAAMARRFVFASWQELPQAIKDTAAAQGARPGDIKAVHWRGKTYLIDRRFADARDVERTIFHEHFAHYGLRQRYGKDLEGRMNRLLLKVGGLSGLQKMAASQNISLDHYIAGAMNDRSLTASQRGALLMDELLAHMAESTGTLRQTLQEWLGVVRSWLRERGYADLARLTAADLSYELRMARQAALETDADTDGAPVFLRSGVSAVADAAATRADRLLDRSMDMPSDWTDAQKKAASKFDTYNPKQPIATTLQSIKGRALERATQLVFDQFRPLQKISDKAFKQAHLSKATDGALEALATRGVPMLRDGAIAISQRSNGFLGALSKLGSTEEASRMLMWVAGNRAERLMGEGRENLFTADDIAAMKSFADGKAADGRVRRPLYAEALKELNTYNKAVLDIAQEAGLVNAESRADWESEFYIPFYRVMDDGKSGYGHGQTGLARQNVVKQLKGGTENLGDPLENLMTNWHSLMTASMRNMAAREALTQADRMGIAERLDSAAEGATWTMENGQKIYWQVEEPMLIDALEALNFNGYNNPAMRAAAKMKQMLTIGVTISPTFRVRNLIRDTLQAAATADVSYNPIKNAIEGWKLTGSDSDTMVQLMAGGGAVRFGSFNDGLQSANTRRLIAMGVKENQIIDSPSKFANWMRRFYDGYQEFGDRAETINRSVIYERVMAETGSHLDASFAARDLMNFTSLGSSAAVRALAQVLPFFNARLQGMDRLVRGAAADPRRFWAVTGTIAMASALLYLLQSDDEEYKALPGYVRDTYWPVKLGGTWAYIPKPFEVGSLGTVVERFTELAVSDGDYMAKDFKDSLVGVLVNTLALNPVPQIVRPAGEAWFNYDMFRQQPIDSMAMERLLPEDRFTANTSAAAVAAGRAFGVSPQKVEHLMRGYFGWLGTQALSVGDLVGRTVMDMPESPRRDLGQVNNWMIVGDFLKSSGTTPSKYAERFYEVQREINTLYATANNARRTGDIDRYMELMGRPEMAARPRIAAANRQITELNQLMRQVTADRNLDPAEKNRQLQALRQRRDAIAQQVDRAART